MVVTYVREKKMEELASLKTKLQDLDNKFIGLSLQHSWSSEPRFSSSTSHGPKLDFPPFNGTDLTGWSYRVEQYFNLHSTLNTNKVPLESFHLEHEALQWFYLYLKAQREPT